VQLSKRDVSKTPVVCPLELELLEEDVLVLVDELDAVVDELDPPVPPVPTSNPRETVVHAPAAEAPSATSSKLLSWTM
jgi:hypothetical protein